MDLPRAPALAPAVAFLSGVALASRLRFLPVAPLALLVAAGIALGRRRGWLLALLAAGVLDAGLRRELPERRALALDPLRPVELVGRVETHWRAAHGGWSALLAGERLRQGRRVESLPPRVRLELPGRGEPPPFGARLSVRGTLRRSAGFADDPPIPPGIPRLSVKSRRLAALVAPPGPLDRLSAGLRRRVERAYAEVGGGSPGAALARALVLGDPSRLPDDWRRGLACCGLAHLLAVSGLHVALVAGLAVLLAFRLPRPARLVAGLAATGLYLLLVGPLPSILRAATMALVTGAALLLGRAPVAVNTLAVTTAALVGADPTLGGELGFRLTVAATAGLLLLAPRLAERWTALPPWLRRPLATSVAAEVAVLPVSLPAFHCLALGAPLWNLLAVPWTGVALAAALPWSGLAVAYPAAARRLLPGLDLIAAPFGWPAATGAGRPFLLPLSLPVPAAWGLAALLAAALLLRPRRGLPALLLLLTAVAAAGERHGVEAALLDVGQGDAILLRDGARALLVDGGGWEGGDIGARVLLPVLAAQGVRRLAAVVMTHPDRDHCLGLLDIASYLPVDEVWTAPGWAGSPCADLLRRVPGARLRLLWAGERAALGRWRFVVLSPPPGRRGGGNERSLVLLAEAWGRRLLLTADIGFATERELLAAAPSRLRAEVLKVAHHGSAGSSSAELLAAARPRLALVSAGRGNVYGHPSPAALARLARAGVPLLRTDRDGMVRLLLGRDGMRVILPGAPR